MGLFNPDFNNLVWRENVGIWKANLSDILESEDSIYKRKKKSLPIPKNSRRSKVSDSQKTSEKYPMVLLWEYRESFHCFETISCKQSQKFSVVSSKNSEGSEIVWDWYVWSLEVPIGLRLWLKKTRILEYTYICRSTRKNFTNKFNPKLVDFQLKLCISITNNNWWFSTMKSVT